MSESEKTISDQLFEKGHLLLVISPPVSDDAFKQDLWERICNFANKHIANDLKVKKSQSVDITMDMGGCIIH